MDSYDITRQFAVTLLELMRRTENKLALARVTLGGVSGSGGGSGNPPGGYNGQLAQRYVTYDTTEAAVSGSVGGSGSIPSLVDNLNRIRANVFVFNDSTLPANVASSAAYGIRAYASRDDHVHTVPLGANMSWVSGSLTSSGASGSGTVGGTGTINYLSKFTAASTIGNSNITDDGSTVSFLSPATSINIAAPNAIVTGAGGLTLYGGSAANDDLILGGTSHSTRATSYILLWGVDSSTTGKVGIATATPKATFSIGGTGNPGFATQITQQLYTDGNFDDHAIIGVNNFWSGAAFGPEDFSDAGVRLDMMGAAANSRQRFSFTISDTTQVDTTILTGAIASDTSYGVLNANSRLYVGAGNATTGAPLATAAIKGNLAIGNTYANATAPTNGIAVEGTVNIGATSNQVIMQAGGVTGTLTWTPASTNKVIAYPNVSGSIALGAGTITNASTNDFYSGSHTHAVSGTFPAALTATYIGFGSGGNLLMGSASLSYSDSAKYVDLNGLGSALDATISISSDNGNESVLRLASDTIGWVIVKQGDGTLGFRSGGVGNSTATLDYATGALSTTVAPTFPSIKLSNTSNQIVMQSAGVTGTLTWTPASTNKIITFPNATGTTSLGAGTLTSSTTNDITSGSHTHAITASPALVGVGTAQYQFMTTGASPFNPAWSDFYIRGTTGQTYTFYSTSGSIAEGAGTLTVSTTDNVYTTSHTHAITSSSNPGVAASLLATDSSGILTTQTLKAAGTTDSTSSTTGEIQSAGGIAAAKNIYVGGMLGVGANPAFYIDAVAPSGADRNIVRFGVSGITSGLFIQYKTATTSLEYNFLSASKFTVSGNILADGNKTRDLGATGTRWNTLYIGTSTAAGTSRLVKSTRNCPVCKTPMVRGTGSLCILGETADYEVAHCPKCGTLATEEMKHLPQEALAKRRIPDKIEFVGFRVFEMSGNSRKVRVDFDYGNDLKNSTYLGETELEDFLAMTYGQRKAFLAILGRREWDALEEVRLMQGEVYSLQAKLDSVSKTLVGNVV